MLTARTVPATTDKPPSPAPNRTGPTTSAAANPPLKDRGCATTGNWSTAGDRREDVDHGAGTDHEIQAAEPAYILAVDEHVDVAAQGACLIPDPSPDQRPRDEGRVQDRPQQGCLPVDRHDELTGTIGQLPQDRRQDDPHTVAHVRTAARTHRTSGSCSAIRAKLSPSSTEAYTSPLRVPK